MCQAFQRAGTDVCLLHPNYSEFGKYVRWDQRRGQTVDREGKTFDESRRHMRLDALAEYYGIDTAFKLRRVPTLQTLSVPQISFLSRPVAMTTQTIGNILAGNIDSEDIIYSRNYHSIYLLGELRRILPARRRPQLIFEHHDTMSTRVKQRFFSLIDGCVTTSNRLKERNCKEFNISRNKVFVGHHGVDLDAYADLEKESARKELGLPMDEDIVAYTGHLYTEKGVNTLVRAAPLIDATVYIVGGYPEDIARIKSRVDIPENVVFTGFIKPAEVPYYQIASDILVAPYSRSALEMNFPLKIFEYLAAGRPIVVSDKQIIKEVLTDGRDCECFEPENPHSLAGSLDRTLNDTAYATALGEEARDTATNYGYEKRAERILSFISHRI